MHAVSACLQQDDQIKTAAIFCVNKENKGGKRSKELMRTEG